MSRYLVTGAAGFIGSHLCEALIARGDSVLGVDSFANNYEPARKRAQFIAGSFNLPKEAILFFFGARDLRHITKNYLDGRLSFEGERNARRFDVHFGAIKLYQFLAQGRLKSRALAQLTNALFHHWPGIRMHQVEDVFADHFLR